MAVMTLIAWWAIARLVGTSHAERANTLLSVTKVPAKEGLQAQLMDPGLDLQSRESLIEKIELQKRAEANLQVGKDNPAPKTPSNQVNPGAIPAQLKVESGIFEGSEGMIRPDQAVITNYWRGVLNGKILIAFAGSKAGDENQGMIILVTASLDPAVSDTTFENFLAPSQAGKMRVVDMKDNHILELQPANGPMVKFDLNTKTFASQ